MQARRRKVWSDLSGNWVRSGLAVVSLAVGTAAVGAMHLAGDTIDRSFEQSFLAANPPSAVLGTSDFPAELVAEIASHPRVGQVEGRRRLTTRAYGGSGDPVNIELVAMVDFTANRVAVIEPVAGAWPPVEGTAVLERASVEALGGGEVISIEVPGRAAVTLDVVGVAFDVFEVAPDLGGLARAYVSMETMTELVGSDDLDTLYLVAANDPLDRDQAVATTAAVRDEVLAPAGVTIELSEIRDPAEHRASSGVRFMVPTMQLLSVLTLGVAVALIANTVSALLVEQRRNIGVMKALGATSNQLVAQYLAFVWVLSSAAFLVASPVSVYAGRRLSRFTAELANFELTPMVVPWSTLAIELAVVVLVPTAAVILSVRRACGVTVREAIADRGISTTGTHGATRLALARPTVLAYRNAIRNPVRLVLTVLSLAVCGAVLLGVMSVGRSLGRLTDEVGGYWAYDIELALTEPVAINEAAAALDQHDAVAAAEGWFQSQAFRLRPDGTENENISITAVPLESSSLRPTLIEGRWFDADDEHPIVINVHVADDEPDLTVGDEVVLDIEGRRRSWNVVGVSSTTLVGPVAYVPVDDLTAVLGRPGQTNFLAIELDADARQADVAELLATTARQRGLAVGQVLTNDEHRAFVDGLFGLVVGFLLAVGAILAVVALVGVAGTMTLSVNEQTREIGVIRTLGASNWAVRRLFLLQGLAISTVGCVLGIILSLPVAVVLRRAIGNSLVATPLPGGFSWAGVAMWIAAAMVIGAVGSTRPARLAAHLTVRDTLAYE